MNKNNTARYLKYAIGEIVLVMIGILLALQINNWNENRKDKKKEQVILKQLKEDYKSNLIQLEQKIATRNKMINSGVQILKAFDQPVGIVRDSLIKKIGDITNDPTFDPIQNDLISSGNLRLISNEKLKRILSNWSSDLVALKEIEVIWSNKMYGQLQPLSNKIGIGRDITNSWMNESDHLWSLADNAKDNSTTIGTSRLITSIDEIISSRELEGLASDAISYNWTANIQSEGLVKRINAIIDLIDKEIKEK